MSLKRYFEITDITNQEIAHEFCERATLDQIDILSCIYKEMGSWTNGSFFRQKQICQIACDMVRSENQAALEFLYELMAYIEIEKEAHD